LSEILGERVDSTLSKAIKDAANSFDEVKGTYDLILHNYGPDKYFGSIHVEVDDTLTADEIDSLSRKISMKIYQECGVILEAIGIYSVNTKDSDVVSLKNKIYEIVNTHEFIIEIHGFRADMKEKNIYMDVIISFSCPDRKRLYDHILTEIRYFYPDYTINMALDVDISN
ncbi:MAG: cation transporter, partial [Lachnospiraceae bacterium]|nr:cation transporter [Lachnospiraceae bacterium]